MYKPIMSAITLLIYILGSIFYYFGLSSFIFGISNKKSYKSKALKFSVLLFILNFFIFVLFNIFGFSFIQNFIIYFFAITVECIIIFKIKTSEAIFVSVEACLCVITPTLFFRSLISLFMNIPLNSFELNLQNYRYWLSYPACLAYICAGIIFVNFFCKKNLEALKHLISAWRQMKFLIVTNIILLIYILIQASFYSTIGNNLSEKLWSVFTCIFIFSGYRSSLKYAIKTSYLYHIDEQNIKMAMLLKKHKKEKKSLEKLAHLDELTGVLNRKSGQDKLQLLIDKKMCFTLCIVDLDGLKYVNDNLGHQSGDIYIKSVVDVLKRNYRADSDILFRYGGDEFIIAFVSASFDVEKRMRKISNDVKQKSSELSIPMQISYGYEYTDGFANFIDVFKKADQNMYKMKQEHKNRNRQLRSRLEVVSNKM